MTLIQDVCGQMAGESRPGTRELHEATRRIDRTTEERQTQPLTALETTTRGGALRIAQHLSGLISCRYREWRCYGRGLVPFQEWVLRPAVRSTHKPDSGADSGGWTRYPDDW